MVGTRRGVIREIRHTLVFCFLVLVAADYELLTSLGKIKLSAKAHGIQRLRISAAYQLGFLRMAPHGTEHALESIMVNFGCPIILTHCAPYSTIAARQKHNLPRSCIQAEPKPASSSARYRVIQCARVIGFAWLVM